LLGGVQLPEVYQERQERWVAARAATADCFIDCQDLEHYAKMATLAASLRDDDAKDANDADEEQYLASLQDDDANDAKLAARARPISKGVRP